MPVDGDIRPVRGCECSIVYGIDETMRLEPYLYTDPR